MTNKRIDSHSAESIRRGKVSSKGVLTGLGFEAMIARSMVLPAEWAPPFGMDCPKSWQRPPVATWQRLRWPDRVKLAPGNQSRVQTPTLRNVDKRPDPAFVKAYGHNGYFTSLKQIVHFYNTRDVLPRCKPHDAGEGTTCWPAPESTVNINTSRVGHLGLSDAEEDALVSFMQTLSDGYVPPN